MSVSFAEKGYRKSSREQVAEVIRKKITNRVFRPGDKLPTTTELVKLAGVSSHTVRQAMMALENEGLVTSTQGKGTFVMSPGQEESAKSEVSKKNSNITVAIMGVFSLDADLPGRYQDETAAGFMEETQRLGLSSHIFSPQVRRMETEDIISSLNEINVAGVIWPAPIIDEWKKIEELRDSGFNIVATQRADSDSWLPAVAGDYQTAGSEVGRYFIEKNCRQVTIFSYSSTSGDLPITMHDGVPNGLIGGVLKAFALSGNTSSDLITVHTNKGYTPKTSGDILAKLSEVAHDSGVIFANSYHFGNLLKDKGEPVKELLKNRHIVVISNLGIIHKLMPLIGDLNIRFLVDPFHKIAAFTVQKLYSQINGHFSDVKSLLKVELKRAKDMDDGSFFGR